MKDANQPQGTDEMTTITFSDNSGQMPPDVVLPPPDETPPGTGNESGPPLIWGGNHPLVSFRAVVPPPALPTKEDPIRKDFYSPPNAKVQGLFRWDPTQGAYVLIKEGANPPAAQETPDPNFVIPEGEKFVQTDKPGGDGPIWCKNKEGKWVQVGIREDGETIYFDAKTCSTVNKFNVRMRIAPPVNEDWNTSTTIPPAEDPAHPDLLIPSPPAEPLGRLRWDKTTETYVKISTITTAGGIRTETPLEQAVFEELSARLGSNHDEIPPRNSKMKTDWVEDDGTIWRLTQDGRVVQVGTTVNGNTVLFDKTTYHTVNSMLATPPAAPTPEEIKALNDGVPLKPVSGAPPQEPDTTHPDRDIPLANGLKGVMRWEPNGERYVFIGTRGAGGAVEYFTQENYLKYNNGTGSLLPKESAERPDYLDSKGILWRWDENLKKDVQVGWKVGADPGTLLDQGADGDASLRHAINSYNDDPAHNLTPPVGQRPLKAPTGEKPADSDPLHPDFVAGLLGNENGTKYVWRWDKDIGRYCAIAIDKTGDYKGSLTDISIDGKRYDRLTDEDYRSMNSGKDGLRFNMDNSPPKDIIPIPHQPDPTNADWSKYDWGSHCKILYRYDPRYGTYVAVAWKPLIGGNYHYFGHEEFQRRNADVINPPATS